MESRHSGNRVAASLLNCRQSTILRPIPQARLGHPDTSAYLFDTSVLFMQYGVMSETTREPGTLTAQLPLKRTFLLPLERFSEHLAQLARGVGSKAELGRRLGVTGQFIDLLIAGKRKPGPKLLKAIGARRKVMIEIDLGAE